ncbi:MAG: ABC transporter permease [Flavobacteriaceae bacterium]
MWRKNLKSFVTHLAKNKLYTFITIFGFAASLTFVIVLSLYIKNELSINASQKNKDRIFRLTSDEDESSFSPPIGQWLHGKYPEIKSFTRIYHDNGIISNKKGIKLKVNYLLADSTFFNMFTFHLLKGDKNTVLKTRHSIVLSKKMAKKLFGNESPIGKQVFIDMKATFTVTGIVDDISKTSNFDYSDAIINFRGIGDIWGSDDILTNYGNCSFSLFFLAKLHTDLPAIAPSVLKLFKKDFWLYKDGINKKVIFEPLVDTYFSTSTGSGIRQNSKPLVFVLLAIVLLILILSVINYINLTIAQSTLRVKQIAIKKLLGSSRNKLIVQHVTETILLVFLAFSLAVLFSFLIEPTFNHLLNTRLNLSYEFKGRMLIIALLIIGFIGFLSGIIPAALITKLNAVEVIKGGFRRKSKGLYSRIMIGFQYTVVIILLISAIIISKQTLFMQNKNPGFNTKSILWLQNHIKPAQKSGLRNKIMNITGVKRVSFVQGSPIDGGNNYTFNYHNKPVSFQVFIVDTAFFSMMQMKIIPTGVAYSKKGVWLNRAAVKKMALDSLPKSVMYGSNKKPLPVLGIISDFNYRSLREKVGPAIVRQLDKDIYPWSILVQIEGNNIVPIVDKIRKTYSNFTGGLPFDYGFFNQTIKKWYAGEKRTAVIVGYFALLSIAISVMGIFAMSIFYTQQKTKEIGIRKVNGATVLEIVKMLNKDFVKWVAVAFVIAAPIAYYAMQRWLENFAYKIALSWWIFALVGMVVLSVALLTVSLQTFKSARKNPVEALQYE